MFSLSVLNRNIFRSLSTKPLKHYDITVFGSGIVGYSFLSKLHHLLPSKSLKTVLIGQRAAPFTLEGFDFCQTSNRTYAISIGAKNLLDSIGIWPMVKKHSCYEVNSMKLWDDQGGRFNFDTNDKDLLCYIVDEKVLSKVIEAQCLKDMEPENIVFDLKTTKISQDHEHVYLTFEDGSTISTNLLVACDGANSFVRNHIDLSTFTYDYDMVAHVASLTSETECSHVAYQKFTNDGIIGILPLGRNCYNVIWHANTELSNYLKTLNDKEFVNHLNARLHHQDKNIFGCMPEIFSNILMSTFPGSISGRIMEKDLITNFNTTTSINRSTFPLILKFASQFALGRIAFAGDAAHRVSPIAGQGLNLGIGDADLLASMVAAEVLNTGSLNDYSEFLANYNRKRQTKAASIVGLTTALKIIYCQQSKLSPILSAGMNFADLLEPLKRTMVDFARY